MGEAYRLDIPCIGTGTLLATIGVPTVCEDGADASRQAVRHLVSQGHKRIGFVMGTFALPWVFQRRQGYLDGLKDAGLEADEGMVCWLDRDTEANCSTKFEEYLQRRQPTAVLFGSWVLVPCLAYLVQRNRIRIPKDLSVITFDQHPNVSTWLNCQPTCLKMPLVEMGRRLAHMAHEVTSGRILEPVTELPCELVLGESVAAI
jgi:LacI family transcriptional regulator, repressor for deo operon, udp, cdd, tsx, nupC, and nupG